MTGILGVVNRDGRPADRRLAERMLCAERHRGSRMSLTIHGCAALGACRADGLAEDDVASFCTVFDGRLDNRDELRGLLAAAGRPPRARSDAELLTRAYEAWGAACAARLRGDFAFAIWDKERRALVCGRDPLGVKPLYLHVSSETILASSEIAPLLVHPDVSREPDEGFIAEHLAGRIVSRTDTVWKGIKRLEPAHVAVIDAATVHTTRYWQIDSGAQIRYKRDEEYADHLADLVRQAVGDRLRSSCRSGPVGVMLSGGLDSSSVVGAVHETAAVNGNGPLRTFSIVSSGAEWDETPYIDAVVAKWPVSPRAVPPFSASPQHLSNEARRFQDLPPYPNGEMANTLFESARAEDVRVLLTGSWSDYWFTGSYHYYADLLRTLRLPTLARHLRAQPDREDIFRPRSMFRSMVWPLVPPAVQTGVKRALGRTGVPAWIDPGFAAAVNLADRVRPRFDDGGLPTCAKRDLHAMAFSGVTAQGMEAHERAASRFGIETRHPFGDVRIVEFGFAIPDDQRWRGATTKYVLRNAARGWLPASVRDRITYGTASSVVFLAIADQVSAGLWQNSVVARRGWIDPAALNRAFEEMTARYRAGDERYDELVTPLWEVCAVELWARGVLEEQPHG